MNLKSILPIKVLKVNRKTVKIPKLSLRHFKLIREVRDIDKNLHLLIESIHKGLTPAETVFVCVHLLEFNNRLKSEVTLNSHTFKVDDVAITQKLEFQSNGKTYKFRSPKLFENLGDVEDILSKCSEQEVDFLEMPAYVIVWADKILNMISVKSDKGLEIKGLNNIIELFAKEQ
ncbi:baseplate hub distal subunit [Pseudomonas phage PspYZU05]|uniref:Baseplate hub distal subunit n=1 Tax=Pseudomonas phage PspYZU05 TaxID=1983556 RepID=A0A2U7NJK7_9CAUD|nr:baseplate hub distal subunit [Pseudomonas phage PspYZU05]ASD52104.1 baseplate hub distal subunit [Pseudomonas phage PspYZU05]